MLDIIQNVELFIQNYDIKGTVLVAFSGGYDSTCLLDVLSKLAPKYDLKLYAIHLNHNWRGQESLEEANKARNFAVSKGVEFYEETLDCSISQTETAARDARYEFFNRCAQKFNSKFIMTAHNLNDNAETLIYRIIKGTGVRGLCGISPNREIFYRPLLNIERNDIEKYCRENNLLPNFDSSNENVKYRRNFIRKEIIPLMQEINPEVIQSINSLSNISKSDNDIIEEYLFKVLRKITKNGKISTKKFLKQSENIQKRLIYNVLQVATADYEKKKVDEILEFVRENSFLKCGKTKSLTSDLWIWAGSKYIEIITANFPVLCDIEITSEGEYPLGEKIFTIEKCTRIPEKFPKDDEFVAYANLNNQDFPLKLRTRREGDRISPLGCNGSQKLKKYLNSKMIPKHKRDEYLFLAKDSEILWAAGLGISEKLRVGEKVTHRLKITSK